MDLCLNSRHLLGFHCKVSAVLEAIGTTDQKQLLQDVWQFFGVLWEKSLEPTAEHKWGPDSAGGRGVG